MFLFTFTGFNKPWNDVKFRNEIVLFQMFQKLMLLKFNLCKPTINQKIICSVIFLVLYYRRKVCQIRFIFYFQIEEEEGLLCYLVRVLQILIQVSII